MSLPKERMIYSIEEYLERERASLERHEYIDGEIFEMSGESPAHGAICTNLTAIVHRQLLRTPCQAFAKDTKVRSGPHDQSQHSIKGLFSYPDLVVVCGELKLYDKYQHVITNPRVIFEVLSPATEVFDRGEKWLRYQAWLPDLTDYVLVSQDMPVIENFHRDEGGSWIYTATKELDSILQLPAISCHLALAEVYDRVVFPETDDFAEETADQE